MANCYLCGKPVTPYEDCESRFLGGSKPKYICTDCIRQGHKKVIERRIEYFEKTYEGQKRMENRYRKKRGK